MTTTVSRPRLAMALGDPAGIGPELIARLLADDSVRRQADIILLADKDEAEHGMTIAGLRFPYTPVESVDNVDAIVFEPGVPVLYQMRGGVQGPFARAESTADCGRYAMATLEKGLRLIESGSVDAMVYAPVNKNSLHLAGMNHSDELHWLAELLGYTGPIGELNTLDGLWTSRATSHVPISAVAGLITQERVLDAVSLMYNVLRDSGLERPRVAVCGLNPHNGDNGDCGREEIEVIAPALEKAKAMGMPVDGPYPADTIFLKVFGDRREYDGVVTMYHDQGQIAIKLMGFQRGVTMQGGLPVPAGTPAHGTAFDISQKGVADVGAMLQAFNVVMRFATQRHAKRSGKA